MTLKSTLSPEDWEQVMQAPFIAGFAVTAADPGGLVGAFQESSAMAKSLQNAPGSDDEETVVGAIFAALKSSEGRSTIKEGLKTLIKGHSPADASAAAVARLTDLMSLVSQKAPSEFDALAGLVRDTATNVAEAAKEGGFMGFGGTSVSDAEKKTLADIDAAISAARV